MPLILLVVLSNDPTFLDRTVVVYYTTNTREMERFLVEGSRYYVKMFKSDE